MASTRRRDALHYNMACLEARTGDRAKAFEHLLRAVELDPEVAEWAQEDADLDAIRDDERFPRV